MMDIISELIARFNKPSIMNASTRYHCFLIKKQPKEVSRKAAFFSLTWNLILKGSLQIIHMHNFMELVIVSPTKVYKSYKQGMDHDVIC